MMRLALPVAPQWILSGAAGLSLLAAVYAAAMALVQPTARRFFSYVFVGHSALVLVGIDIVSPVGLTGALALLVLSTGLAGAAPGPGEVGGPAPDWTLNAYGGGTQTLSDYQDKVVMMFVVGYG